jgi:hypothetical protein
MPKVVGLLQRTDVSFFTLIYDIVGKHEIRFIP